MPNLPELVEDVKKVKDEDNLLAVSVMSTDAVNPYLIPQSSATSPETFNPYRVTSLSDSVKTPLTFNPQAFAQSPDLDKSLEAFGSHTYPSKVFYPFLRGDEAEDDPTRLYINNHVRALMGFLPLRKANPLQNNTIAKSNHLTFEEINEEINEESEVVAPSKGDTSYKIFEETIKYRLFETRAIKTFPGRPYVAESLLKKVELTINPELPKLEKETFVSKKLG